MSRKNNPKGYSFTKRGGGGENNIIPFHQKLLKTWKPRKKRPPGETFSLALRVGSNIRRLRERLPSPIKEGSTMSQKDLAAILRVKASYVSMLEAGRKKPSLEAIQELAYILKADPLELFMPTKDEK